MIASLTGTKKPLNQQAIIIDVRGVGYKVFVPPSLLPQAPKLTTPITLYTHTHVRDDALDLYGFKTREDLNLFILLINVSGVGPKIAITLIDKGVKAISSAVAHADIDFFTSVPRLGKKNAQKIIIDLKSKIGDLEDLDLTDSSVDQKEVLDALVGLGFSKKQALQAMKSIDTTLPIERKITLAIKFLGKQ